MPITLAGQRIFTNHRHNLISAAIGELDVIADAIREDYPELAAVIETAMEPFHDEKATLLAQIVELRDGTAL